MTSDGMQWAGIGCDVCGFGSVENCDEFDPTEPCPECGTTMQVDEIERADLRRRWETK